MLENENSTTPETEVSGDSTQSLETSVEQPVSDSITDLDSIEKFRFGGREWTRDEFKNAYLMQQDYTKKTQQLSEERKYFENLQYDLDKVRSNPALADKFKSIYPKQYHRFLDYITPVEKAASQGGQNQAPANLDPEFVRRFEALESSIQEERVKAADAQLDAHFETLKKKYADGDEELVISRAIALRDQGENVDAATIEKLWKATHDAYQKRFEQSYASKIKEQKTINEKSKDVPSGGGVPGKAPAKFKNIKEAAQAASQNGVF